MHFQLAVILLCRPCQTDIAVCVPNPTGSADPLKDEAGIGIPEEPPDFPTLCTLVTQCAVTHSVLHKQELNAQMGSVTLWFAKELRPTPIAQFPLCCLHADKRLLCISQFDLK